MKKVSHVRTNAIVAAFVFGCTVVTSLCMATTGMAAAKSTTETDRTAISQPLYTGDFDIVAAKCALASLHDDEYVEMNDEETAKRTSEIEDVIFSNIADDEKRRTLEGMHVYKLEIPEENKAEYASDSVDVILDPPVIYYDSNKKYWGIYASGHWKNGCADYNFGNPFAAEGDEFNVGDVDAYGFVIDDISGIYTASLKSQKCVISDNKSNINKGNRKTSFNRSTGSGKEGLGFKLQDKALISSRANLGFTNYYTYIGDSFACIGWYTDSFKNYKGNVQTVYGHTYSWCELSKFEIGADAGKDGFNVNCTIEFSKANQSFSCHSTDTNLYNDGFSKTKKTNLNSVFNP